MSGKKRIYAIFALAALLILPALAAADSGEADAKARQAADARARQTESAISDQTKTRISSLDVALLQRAADDMIGKGKFDVYQILDKLRAGEGMDAELLLRQALGMFAVLFKGRVAFMIALITCAALAGVAARLGAEPGGARVSEMACLCVAAGLIVADFVAYAAQARQALTQTGAVLDALMPLMAGLMAALGAKLSGGLIGGALAAAAGAGVKFGREYIIDMALISAALELCSGLNSRLRLNKAAELMRTLAGLLVGAALVVELGAITVNGQLGADIDGVSVRAAKFALDNIVPVVGGEIKDTVEVIAASCMLVESLLGTCGMLLLLIGVAKPVIGLAAAYVSYKACAAVVEAAGGARLQGLLEGFAKVLRTLMIAVLGAAALIIMLLGALNFAARGILAAG